MKKILLLLTIITAILVTGCSGISIAPKNEKKNAEAGAYILPSDTQVITEVDLSKLNDTELKYAYEEIFARHGKIYTDSNFEKYFNSQEWYTPNPSFDESDLSGLEKENAEYIAEYIANKVTEGDAPTEPANTTVKYDANYYYNNYRGDNTYIIPDSSVRRLTISELYGYSPETLALIRNEIYARNGYVFSKQKYRDYFSSKLWYNPNPDFNEGVLNEIEKYNIQLIKSLE